MSTSIFLFGGLVLGLGIGYFVRQAWASKQLGSLEQEIKQKSIEAENRAKEILVEAKEKAANISEESQKEERERKKEILSLESRIHERETSLEKKLTTLDEESTRLRGERDAVESRGKEIEELKHKAQAELEKVSGLSKEEAKKSLFSSLEEEHKTDLAKTLQKLEQNLRGEVEKKSVEIISTALQRYARSHVSELTTTVFHLADEDVKGKIIGREGRNIRALERATGVEFVMDETPDTIIISSFDPLRREIARLALENLIKDGRIQPAKIEEKVEEAKEELNKRIAEIGETSAMEVGIYDLPKELLQLLGRLHFRTSFGQNVLNHSIEMTYLAGMMAAELGLNVAVAKKAALLHDIGKAIDHEVEGTHVDLGIKILKKYGIAEDVINGMRSHHEDYPYASPESFLITAVDVLSAARPGARRGTVENHIRRLADLEKIASEFPGVKSAYAISAGRELRVFVMPEKIDDFRALEMAREIANKIQSELKYPGEIKVNVIREMRAVEYAR
jgi:ribonuclease Y